MSRGAARHTGTRLGQLAAALIWATLVCPQARAAKPESPEAPADVRAPRLLSDATVPYPEGGQGEASVRLTVVVDPDGAVRSATPDETNEPFSSVASSSVLSWRFEPALRAGRAVAAKIRLEIQFHAPVPELAAELEAEPTAASARAASSADTRLPSGSAESKALEPAPREILVSGERPEPSRTATLSRAEVRELPGAFGDPFRALESLPGVTPIVSGLPFFFVRGAPPGNVGYFLDGVRLPLLFHVGAGPAVVHPGLIDHVDLYPGGYPARFGRFSGGIISGETAAPRGELHGEYNVRLFDAGALVETPFAEGRGSALLGGRYSYTGLLLSLLSPDIALEYWDYQARAGYDLSPRDRVSAFAFGSYDYLGQKTQSTTLTLFATEFHRLDLRYDRKLPRDGTLRTAFTLGLDRSSAQQDRVVRDRLAGARTELNLPLSENLRLRAGSDLQLDRYDIELTPADASPTQARIAALFPSRTDLALGLRGDLVWVASKNFEVTPGLRVDLYGSEGSTALAVDPRLSTRTTLSSRVHLLSALGIAHQPPSFVVPLPGFQPGGLRGGLQYALQESVGIEALFGEATTLTATLFRNAFFNMSDPLGATEPVLNGCPPGAFPGDSLAGDRGNQPENASGCRPRFRAGTLGPDRSGGGGQGADGQNSSRIERAFEVRTLGSAYGLELYLKRRLTSRVGGFISYTLSRSTRSYGNRSYVATFDRTHVANAALAYDLGRRWRAGARVVFYTGLPQAPVPGSSSTRLPAFFRTDLRLEKRWQLAPDAWISLVAEWMNATLSKEAVSTTCTLEGCEYQEIGPVTIPSLGVEGAF